MVSWYFLKFLLWFGLNLETGKQGELGKNVFLTSRARRTSCNDLEKKTHQEPYLLSTFLRYTLMLLIRLYVLWFTWLAQYYCGGVVSLCGKRIYLKRYLKPLWLMPSSQYRMVTRSGGYLGGYLVSTLFFFCPHLLIFCFRSVGQNS